MYYGEIKRNDIANGEGVRVSLFVSGCRNCCPGCFNRETWDFQYGQEFTAATEELVLTALEPPHVSGLTVLGGEPFEPENQQVLAAFLQRVKLLFPQKDIWCFTGCILERDILSVQGRCHTAACATLGTAQCEATGKHEVTYGLAKGMKRFTVHG